MLLDSPNSEPSVLIISDELKLVESLRGAFGSGCQVFLCPTVAIGLDRVRHERVSAVLLNLALPGLIADQAMAAIRMQCGESVMIMGFQPGIERSGELAPHTAVLQEGGGAVAMPLDWRGMRGLLSGAPQLSPSLTEDTTPSVEAETTAPELVRDFGLFPSRVEELPLSVEPHAEPGHALRLIQGEGLVATSQPVTEPTPQALIPSPTVPQETVFTGPFGLFEPEEPVQLADNVIPFPMPWLPAVATEALVNEPVRAIAAPADAEEEQRPASSPLGTFLRDEAELMEKGNRFLAHCEGEDVQGQVMRMSSHYVVCESRNPDQLLVPDAYAEEAIVYLGSREAYRGPARLSKVLNTGRSQVAEWALLGKWLDDQPEATTDEVLTAKDAGHPLSGFFDRMRVLTRVSEVFKATLAEMASLLGEVVQCLDRIEADLPTSPAAKRIDAMKAILPQLQKQVFGAFDDVFSRFEKVAETIPAELAAEHHSLIRQHLHTYVMCAPFIHHIYAKPLGFAGDYGALQKLLADPYEGRSLFAKMLNAWLVLNPAGDAYRMRVQTLTDHLQMQAQDCHAKGQEFRTLSIGCGAANEIVEFLKNEELSNNANITLVDFNDPTLEAAKAQVTRTQREYWRLTRVRWIKQSLQSFVADEIRLRKKGGISCGPVVRAQGYEFISCTGLLDYFSDRVCRRLISALWTNLAPGGRLLICNFTPANPIQHFMTYLLDWKLIYRNAEELRALLPEDVTAEQCSIFHSPGAVEVYLCVRKL
jgi:extracellular factor (EF) 3-hydroxypalmitic acid methyl ester biosynthesis protein